jgi:hypothetical protein
MHQAMTRNHGFRTLVILLSIALAIGMGAYLARPVGSLQGTAQKVEVASQTPKKDVLPPVSAHPPPTEGLASPGQTDRLAKVKELHDKRHSNAPVLPWEKNTQAIEDFSRRLWNAKRGDYIKLFDSWKLSPEQKAKLESIILDRDIKRRTLEKQADDAGYLTPESTRLIKAAQATKVAADVELGQVIGADRLQQLKILEDSGVERRTLSSFTSALPDAMALTPEQEQAVLNALYLSKKSINDATGRNLPGTVLGKEYRDQVLKSTETQLSADQQAALKDKLERDAATFERLRK